MSSFVYVQIIFLGISDVLSVMAVHMLEPRIYIGRIVCYNREFKDSIIYIQRQFLK